MANAQVGNKLGLAAIGQGRFSEITADGVNTVTVLVAANVPAGTVIDIINKTTGAILATNRTVTNVTSAGVVTYNGADVTAVPGTHVVVPFNTALNAGYPYLNGGADPSAGFELNSTDTVALMRAALLFLHGYTAAQMDAMTVNDMIYALRVLEAPNSI